MSKIIVTVCCAIALLAACGGDESSPTGATAADATTSTTAANDGDADVVAIETPPCELVTSDDVASATGLAVGDATEQPPLSCIFAVGNDSGIDVYVNADDGAGRGIGPAAVFAAYEDMVVEGSAEAVTGVGEAAFYSQGFRTLAVNAGGGKFIAVGVNGGYSELDEPREALIAIATAAIGRI